jgi:hypothetical protein
MDTISDFLRSLAHLMPYMLAMQLLAGAWLFWKIRNTPSFLMLFGAAMHLAGYLTITRVYAQLKDLDPWVASFQKLTVSLMYLGFPIFTIGFVWFVIWSIRNITLPSSGRAEARR